MFELDDKSFIIDTPGIKELGVFEIGEDELGHYFPEMRDLLGQCKFHNCKHINEPKCAVIEKVKTGEIALSRYESYLSIIMNHDAHR
jgi:ribosome biogenesis GTPase / thiamine phosphate phosphatase